MKKIYFLFVLCCLNFAASAINVTVNAVGASGSYKTGYTQATSGRTDGDMVIDATGPVKRGYAVFDLAGVVPTGATVSAVSIRFNFSTSGTGLGVACGIYGFASDLSTVTTPATLFADCSSGTAFNTTNWGASTTGAQDLLPFNGAGITFIQTNAGTKISICFATTSAGNVYTLVGEGGTAATQPQLQVTYTCTGVSGVTATPSPNPICVGSTLTLLGAATGTTTYSWAGPAGYSSTLQNPSFVASASSGGVYTFTATNAGGCGTTVTTAAVIVNPLPAAITGPVTVCAGSTVALTDASGPGTWTSSNSSIATVGLSTGIVGGVSGGTANINFTITSTGCNISRAITVITTGPGSISGTPVICVGATAPFSDATPGGSWTSGTTSVATVNSSSGVVSGVAAGSSVITYSIGCGTAATYTVTVQGPFAAITGPTAVCSGNTIRLSDATPGGMWTSSNSSVATIGIGTGILTGVSGGTVTIAYSNGFCPVFYTVTVNPTPTAIIAPSTSVCIGATIPLSDATAGGTWTSSLTTVATVGSATGIVTGVAQGNTTISYNRTGGCSATLVVSVYAVPGPVTGTSTVCPGATVVLSNAAIGGTWSSAITSVATVGSSNGIVTGVSPGTSFITYTGFCGSSSLLVTVSPGAVPIAGTLSVCGGIL